MFKITLNKFEHINGKIYIKKKHNIKSKLNKRKTKLTLIYWDKSKVLFEHEQSLR